LRTKEPPARGPKPGVKEKAPDAAPPGVEWTEGATGAALCFFGRGLAPP
jgi:hypothetical protein